MLGLPAYFASKMHLKLEYLALQPKTCQLHNIGGQTAKAVTCPKMIETCHTAYAFGKKISRI
jgi:hypothetical protein